MKKDMILKYALQNAIKYDGKANPGAVIGKLIQEDASVKKKLKELNPKIQEVIKEISKLSVSEQTEKLKKLAPELLEEKKRERRTGLKELKNTDKMVMRFEPSLSGPMHIGHAYALSLNSEYCRMYKGKLIIRLADTNPDNIYEPAYDLLPKDAEWITKGNVAEVMVQSSRMETYYSYAEQLINKGHAYVCTCEPNKFREKSLSKEACPCRENSVEENLDKWKRMHKLYKEGEAVVRIKTDIKHKNPAMRDWPALRVKTTKHPKTGEKYRVWPLLNFAVAIDDHESCMTHTVRAKDHMDNEKKQKYIFDYMGWKVPDHIYIGKINFEDLRVSCSKTRPFIEDGTYSGWDDIRLPFLVALKRRGYQADAFIKYAMDVGVTQNDKSVSKEEFFKTMNAFNRDVIDPIANRYFVIKKPKKIKIENAPEQDVELKLHPDDLKRGVRKFKTKDEFYISEEDYKGFEDDKLYRLMDCLNFKKEKGKLIYDSPGYEEYKKNGKKIIHWLPSKDTVKVEVLMPDGALLKCLAEKSVANLKVDDIIQAERFGFMRLDEKKKDKLVFWFTHG